jgi:hypothetical protein
MKKAINCCIGIFIFGSEAECFWCFDTGFEIEGVVLGIGVEMLGVERASGCIEHIFW